MDKSNTVKILSREYNPYAENNLIKINPKLWTKFKTNAPTYVMKTVVHYKWFKDNKYTIRQFINEDKKQIIFELTGVPNDNRYTRSMLEWHDLIKYMLVHKGTHDQCNDAIIFKEEGEILSMIELSLYVQ